MRRAAGCNFALFFENWQTDCFQALFWEAKWGCVRTSELFGFLGGFLYELCDGLGDFATAGKIKTEAGWGILLRMIRYAT